mmetsp:Transcript_41389/g.119088  ORF Transcript_41389/g.119088 Transcript_41389/m.119088 type:complete len:299 (-) Transcript_41389:130-1026(-)
MGQDMSSTAASFECNQVASQTADEQHELQVDAMVQSSSVFEEDSDSSLTSGAWSEMQRIIVFDWDDTLLCSTAMKLVRGTTEEEAEDLTELGESVEALLKEAMGYGEVMVITNGAQNWVKESASRHIPGLLPTLHKIRCISARHLFEDEFPGDPFMWKQAAFRRLIADGRGSASLDLVSIGDQMPEIEAARGVARILGPSCQVKTVKMRAQPRVAELVGQIRRLQIELGRIVDQRHSHGYSMIPRSLAKRHGEELASSSGAESWRLSRDSPVKTFFQRGFVHQPCVKIAFVDIWPLLS